MIEDLARMILEAQRIREESWDETGEWNAVNGKYTRSNEEAVREAGETSGLDIRANWLVHIMLTAWNDFGAWAEGCLKEVT